MPEYIDRESLLAEFEWLKSVEYPYQRDRTEDAIQRIKNAPVADVAPVRHGRWIDNGANGYKWAFVCSMCGYVDGHPFDNRHNFCPNCGTRMNGGDNDDT